MKTNSYIQVRVQNREQDVLRADVELIEEKPSGGVTVQVLINGREYLGEIPAGAKAKLFLTDSGSEGVILEDETNGLIKWIEDQGDRSETCDLKAFFAHFTFLIESRL